MTIRARPRLTVGAATLVLVELFVSVGYLAVRQPSEELSPRNRLAVAPPSEAPSNRGQPPPPMAERIRVTPAGATSPVICRNSYDRACGPFRWDPAPINTPASLAVALSTNRPYAGQEFTAEVSFHDAEAGKVQCFAHMIRRKDEPPHPGERYSYRHCPIRQSASEDPDNPCRFRYGPWTPPPPEPVAGRETTPFRFSAAGTYTIIWTALLARNLCGESYLDRRGPDYDAYVETARSEREITVRENPAGLLD